jgi:hypothetical protein
MKIIIHIDTHPDGKAIIEWDPQADTITDPLQLEISNRLAQLLNQHMAEVLESPLESATMTNHPKLHENN